ncbi:MAG: hypothetical protein AABY86_05550 [Bdellovibrionota bacterium]
MDDSTLVPSEVRISPRSQWYNLLHFAKFCALILLAILIVLMIIGTLAEGYAGAEFAGRLIYYRWYFIGPIFLILVYVIIAFCSAIPFQRQFVGTYLFQFGLILLGLEYLMTSWNSVNGTMTLRPNVPSNAVTLPDDVITITYEGKDNHSNSESRSFDLPNTAFTTKLHHSYRDIALSTFIPFSQKVLKWTYPSGPNPGTFPSSQYQIKRTVAQPHFDLDIVFSLHPEAKEFTSPLSISPLEIQYVPEEVAPCFDRLGASKIILWDIQSKVCFTPEEQKIPILRPVVGKRFMAIKRDHEFHSFFPDFSPYPLTQDLNPIKTSPLRVMALNNFEAGQSLFLMGPNLAFMKEDKWVKESLPINQQYHIQNLMLDITLLHHTVEKIPVRIPQFVYPRQQQKSAGTPILPAQAARRAEGQEARRQKRMIRGKDKAVEVLAQGRSYWVTSDAPLQIEVNKQLVTLQLKKKTIEIPFRLSLSQVHADGSSLHIIHPMHRGHYLISTNHPLQFDEMTFVQKLHNFQENTAILIVSMPSRHRLKYIGLLMAFLGLIIWIRYQQIPSEKSAGT